MNHGRSFLPVVATLALLAGVAVLQAESFAELQDGQVIADRLRSIIPEADSEWRGVLKIRRPGQPVLTVPVTSRVVAGESRWKVIYTSGATNQPAETLTVIRSPNTPNLYEYARASGPGAPLGEAKRLTAEEANISFAGSDFWLTDLGLEFLHWPNQRRLKGEVHRSTSCHVLESRPATVSANGYSRVVSWIDRDTGELAGGPLDAEGYDKSNKLQKEFSVGSFKKVDGIYQLKEMDIRNRQTGSRTKLEFDLTGGKD